MTTHDEQISTDRPAPASEAAPVTQTEAASVPRTEPAAAREAAGAPETAAPAHEAAAAVADEPTAAGSPTDDNTVLFAEQHRSGLHSRWNDVQAAFVDDPKQCVQNADSLVQEVVDELTASFADTRSRLEAQWARGEDASTEDLRVALTRYRDFFERLLSV